MPEDKQVDLASEFDNNDNFWDDPMEDVITKPVVEPIADEDEKPENTQPKPEEKKNDEFDFSDGEGGEGDEKPETTTDTDDEDEPGDEGGTVAWGNLFGDLKTTGLFDNMLATEDGENMEVKTDEDFQEAMAYEIEQRLDIERNEFADSLGEDGKQFLAFQKTGGTMKEFMNIHRQIGAIPEYDIENEESHDDILKFYYENIENLDPEDIADKMEWLEEKGKKTTYAQKYGKVIAEQRRAIQDKAFEDKEAQKKASETRTKEFVDSVSTIISEKRIGDTTLSPKEAKELEPYMTKLAATTSKGKTSQFRADVSDLFSNPEKRPQLVLFAKLLKDNFELKSLDVKTTTKVAKGIKEKLDPSNYKKSSAAGGAGKSLADKFN